MGRATMSAASTSASIASILSCISRRRPTAPALFPPTSVFPPAARARETCEPREFFFALSSTSFRSNCSICALSSST